MFLMTALLNVRHKEKTDLHVAVKSCGSELNEKVRDRQRGSSLSVCSSQTAPLLIVAILNIKQLTTFNLISRVRDAAVDRVYSAISTGYRPLRTCT